MTTYLLPTTTTTEAITYGRLLTMHRHGHSLAALARRAGLPRQTLQNRLKRIHGVKLLSRISRHAYVRRGGVTLA